jgi:hypothetical protein
MMIHFQFLVGALFLIAGLTVSEEFWDFEFCHVWLRD